MARIIHIADAISEIFLDDEGNQGFHELSNFYIVVSEDKKRLHCATDDRDIADTVKSIIENREGVAAGQELISTSMGTFPRDFLEKPIHRIRPVYTGRVSREEYESHDNVEAIYSDDDPTGDDRYGDN